MVTQVAPFNLVGNFSERPTPAEVPAGYVFHALDTLQSFILVITAAGVRQWNPLGGGGSGLVFKFAGEVLLQDIINDQPVYLGDDNVGIVVSNHIQQQYGLRNGGHLNGLFVTVLNNKCTQDVEVDVLMNNIVVGSIVVPALTTGKFSLAVSQTYAPSDTFDVSVTTLASGGSGDIQLSATLDFS